MSSVQSITVDSRHSGLDRHRQSRQFYRLNLHKHVQILSDSVCTERLALGAAIGKPLASINAKQRDDRACECLLSKVLPLPVRKVPPLSF